MELKEEYSTSTLDSTNIHLCFKALLDTDVNEESIALYPNFFIHNLKGAIRKDPSYIHILISLIDYNREPYTTQQLREEFDTMRYVFPRGYFFTAKYNHTNLLIRPYLDVLLTSFRHNWLKYCIGLENTASWEQYSSEIKSRVLNATWKNQNSLSVVDSISFLSFTVLDSTEKAQLLNTALEYNRHVHPNFQDTISLETFYRLGDRSERCIAAFNTTIEDYKRMLELVQRLEELGNNSQ